MLNMEIGGKHLIGERVFLFHLKHQTKPLLAINYAESADWRWKNRSEREFDREGILGGFHDSAHGDKFEVADGKPLGLE